MSAPEPTHRAMDLENLLDSVELLAEAARESLRQKAGLEAQRKLVDELRAVAPLAQRTAKKLLNDIEAASLSRAIELEGQCYDRLRSSEDFREGVEAFAAKRPQNFRGR